jgi:hypothetical protein
MNHISSGTPHFADPHILRIAEHLHAGSRKGASRGHEARILLRRLDIPGHVDFYVQYVQQ